MIYICYIKHVKKGWESELAVWDNELVLSGGCREGRESHAEAGTCVGREQEHVVCPALNSGWWGPSEIAGCWGIQECLPNDRATWARVDLSLGSANCDNQVGLAVTGNKTLPKRDSHDFETCDLNIFLSFHTMMCAVMFQKRKVPGTLDWLALLMTAVKFSHSAKNNNTLDLWMCLLHPPISHLCMCPSASWAVLAADYIHSHIP